MQIVKIRLEQWSDNCFYKAEKVHYKNHRDNDRVLYKVISRHSIDIFGKERSSDKLKGLVYYPVDVLEIN